MLVLRGKKEFNSLFIVFAVSIQQFGPGRAAVSLERLSVVDGNTFGRFIAESGGALPDEWECIVIVI